MIRIRNLTFSYIAGGPPSLCNLNLTLTEGEYVALIGPNGCGKTTFIRHLNALLLPTSGEVLIDDLSTLDVKNWREIRRRVGMIFQNPDNQIVGMTVEEDVAFGPGNLGLPSAEIRRRVDRALARRSGGTAESSPAYPVRRTETTLGPSRSIGDGSYHYRPG